MIRFENIRKTYGEGESLEVALNGVDGNVDEGEIVAMCGPSGSGKSTLLNICGLIDASYCGTLLFNDVATSDQVDSLTEIRRQKLGFIFQSYNLVPVMTAFENVEYPLQLLNISGKKRRELVNDMFNKVGLRGQQKKRPDQMSGGQQQRVAIARALIKQPKVVIADEPTANLDTNTANIVIQLIRSMGREMGTTFVVATHDERMSQQCDRVIRMQDGEIINGAMLQDESSIVTENSVSLKKGGCNAVD